MHHQRHFDRVRGLVSGYCGVPEAEITLESRLVEDLGMGGDDGRAFLESFADEFDVDVSRLAPVNYFDHTPPLSRFLSVIPLVAAFSPAFRRYVGHATRGRRAVTVRSLVRSAQAGVWMRPERRMTDADPLCRTLGAWVGAAAMAVFLGALLGATWHLLQGIGGQMSWGAAVLLTVLWGLLAAKIVMALRWLRRLDAAATAEEQALTEAR